VEAVTASVDQWTQGIREELDAKIEERQLDLQVVTTSLDTRTRRLYVKFTTEILATK
jgi:hypothetical protein